MDGNTISHTLKNSGALRGLSNLSDKMQIKSSHTGRKTSLPPPPTKDQAHIRQLNRAAQKGKDSGVPRASPQNIVAKIFLGLTPGLVEAAAFARDEDDASTSVNENYSKTRSSPHVGNGRDPLGTAKCSRCGCHRGETRRFTALKSSYDELDQDNVELYAKNEDLTAQVRQLLCNHAELDSKYKMQLKHRRGDKAKLDEAFEFYQDAENEKVELEAKLETNAVEHDNIVKQLQAQLKEKDQEVAKLKEEHRHTMQTLLAKHKKELAAKEEQLKKAADERSTLEAKACKEKKVLINAANIHRKTAEDKQESLEKKIQAIKADYSDALQANTMTIHNLTDRNLALEKEHQCMSNMLKMQFPRAQELHRVIDNNIAGRQENKDLRARLKQATEQIENLLDKIQQMEGQYTRHQNAEQDARSESNRLQLKVFDLQDRIDRQKVQILDAEKQFSVTKSNQGISDTGFAGILAIERENESLRELLIAERLSKEDLQKETDKFDAETLRLAVNYECIEAELIEFKRNSKARESSISMQLEELQMLRMMVKMQNGTRLGNNVANEIWAWVAQETDKVKAVIEENKELTDELSVLRKKVDTIEEKHSIELYKCHSVIKEVQDCYWNEAVCTVERLHDEIHALKVEKGESHYVESAQPANQAVADRNALRCATMQGFDDDIKGEIPWTAIADPKFCDKHVPATYEALMTLRPQGWHVHWEAGKVWMKREFEPTSEEDAVAHLQAQQHVMEKKRDESVKVVQRPSKIPKAVGIVAKKALIQKPKARPVQPRPAPDYSASPPSYESRFAKINGMTKEMYDELEDDNKHDFVNMYVVGHEA